MLTTILFAVLPVLGLLAVAGILMVMLAILVGGGQVGSPMVERAAPRDRFVSVRRLDEHQGVKAELAI